MLEREEYIEQAYLFRALGERMRDNMAAQDLLTSLKEEILSTTRLPMAIDFLAAELRLQGVIAPAMARLKHYFAPFQTFVIAQAEDDHSRFDFAVALEMLQREAQYRAEGAPPQGMFMYQFETLCRNRLPYDRGLAAMAQDPMYDQPWRDFCLLVQRQVGLIDIADLIFVNSAYYEVAHRTDTRYKQQTPGMLLFGEKEGKIALANRRKDPLLLFAALQRHLNYPVVPRPKRPDENKTLVPQLLRRVERLESRVKLLEEEQRGGIDLSKFAPPPDLSDL